MGIDRFVGLGRIISVVWVISYRHTGNERGIPKLPYQAVVIRQSARLQKGSECRSAVEAVRIIPVRRESVGDRCPFGFWSLGDAKPSQHGREQFSHLDRPSAACLLVENLAYDFGFVIACFKGQLVYRVFQFVQEAIDGSVVFVVKGTQFLQD